MRYDLLVIGGGINGTAIARAAAVAGLRLLLVEQDDLAQATSSASTKLIHGGLRYLERYEFGLVHESLSERAILLRTAPHLVHPLEFRIPHQRSLRAWPVMRMGLWLYDLLAWRGNLPSSRSLILDDPDLGDTALRDAGGRGFGYWDARVDDARLVVANALDAAAAGATILTRTRCLGGEAGEDGWTVSLQAGDRRWTVSAGTVVNATGPWVEQLLRQGFARRAGPSRLRLVRGSHIIVRRCFEGEHAWLFQQPDGRVVFAIPYQRDFTLIGTTDMPVDTPGEAQASADEVEYLLAAINRYRRQALAATDVIGRYAGIRALFDDGSGSASAVSRDYYLDLASVDGSAQGGPRLLSVFGGKITTARHLAEVALKRLGIGGGDTRLRPLPGGDIADWPAFVRAAGERWPFIARADLERMAQAYGTRLPLVLGDARSRAEMGVCFGAGLHACEVDYLIGHEWARSAQDIAWRRSRLGLWLDRDGMAALAAYVDARTGAGAHGKIN